MNERIRDIAEHCDFYVGNEHFEKSHEEQQRIWAEKFAELIVGECIEQMEKCFAGGIETDNLKSIWGESSDTFKSWNAAIKCSRGKIKEYFGVEE